MQELDDIALLRQYTEQNSEEAFAALVSRHVNKVYSVALRHTHNPHQAEEITQAVFVILARKSPYLGRRVILSGWLYQTARLTAVNFIRSEIRRACREQEAHMQNLLNDSESDVWPQIAPLLDAAMAGLSETDRHAVVLRFFDGKSMREVGIALGASEDAAKMRLNRAVEKLRGFFRKRGVVLPAAVLTAAISANSVQAAPAALAKTATIIAFAKGATASGSTPTFIKGALKIMAWTKAKTAIAFGIAAILVAGTATTAMVHHNHHAVGQTDFPRSSWKNAGYADPVSAFETAFWAASRNDGKVLFYSLSPDLQQSLEQRAKRDGGSPEEFLSQNQNSADHLNGVTGFHILKSEMVSDSEVRLHLSIEGRQVEQTFAMKRIGKEWKMDSFPSGF